MVHYGIIEDFCQHNDNTAEPDSESDSPEWLVTDDSPHSIAKAEYDATDQEQIEQFRN